MFQIVTDKKTMDALWEEELLWYRNAITKQWQLDTTDLRPSQHTDVPYAILMEE